LLFYSKVLYFSVNRFFFISQTSLIINRKSYLLKKMMSEEECRGIWKKVDAVCFDVDSTVLKDEALDELAKFCGVGEQVIEW